MVYFFKQVFSLSFADKNAQMKKLFYIMIVVNPRNHRAKSAIFRMAFAIFTTLVSVTFFWYCLVEIQLLKMKGLDKLDLIKWP